MNTVTPLSVSIAICTGTGLETLPPHEMAERLNRFYSELTQVIVHHGIIDKLIGDAVMGLYFAPLICNGGYVDAMVSEALTFCARRAALAQRPAARGGHRPRRRPGTSGRGEGEIRDVTAIGDAVNTASRQALRRGARSSCPRLSRASRPSTVGEVVTLDLKGKAEPITARRITVGS